jgi:hypothetical protein
MNNLNLNDGNLLDIIKINSTSSIRGMKDPHITFLAKFIFSDHEFNSFDKLASFGKDKSNLDEINFISALSYILVNQVTSSIDIDKELRLIKFSNKNYSKLINYTNNFIVLNKVKLLNSIKDLDIDNDLKHLSLSFCFKYSNLDFDLYCTYFPQISDVFSISKNNIIKISSLDNFKSFVNNDGLLSLFFITKFYSSINTNDIFNIVEFLIDSMIFDAFILDKYIKFLFEKNINIFNFFSTLKEHIPHLDERIITALSHYMLLSAFNDNNYSYIVNWSKQFSNKLNKGEISKDFDSFVNYELEDNRFEPVQYWPLFKNSRFYINTIQSLTQYISNNVTPPINSLDIENINVIGGIHGLSLINSFDKKYNVNFSFHYNDRFLHSNNSFSLNHYDLELLSQDKSSIFIIIDPEFYLHDSIDINIFLDNLLDQLKINLSLNNLYFCTTPLPSILTFRYFDGDKCYNKIKLFNDLLLVKQKVYNFKLFDINKNLIFNNNFLDSNCLINNYIIKPNSFINCFNKGFK